MFYFNISDAELKANGLSQDKQEQELRKQEENYCKLKGAYINEPVIVASMPADAIDRSSLKMAREEFEQLEQDVHKSIELISDSIVRGDISISPAKLQKGSRESECRYCQYRAICKFDPSYRGNNYHMV